MKYTLLDTNAMSALLKEDDFGRLIAERASKEEWVFVLHTAVDAELGQVVRRKSGGIVLEDFYERFLPSNRFGVAKSIKEIRSAERGGFCSPALIQPCDSIYGGFVQTTKVELDSLLDRTHQLSDKAQALAREMFDHSVPKLERIRKRSAGLSGENLLDQVESSTPSLGLSSKICFLGIWYKMLEGNRKIGKNDFFDLSFFYLLPYVHVVVTENNSGEIIKKIKTIGLLSDLEVIRVTHKQRGDLPTSQQKKP